MTSYTFNNKPLAVRDTGVAKLPAIPAIAPDGSNAAAVMNAMKERLEVREGSRGNPHERAVTVREFAEMAKVVEKMEPVVAAVDAILGGGGAGSASRAIDAFTKSIKELPLYKDLMKRLDDPSRFDKLPAEIREVLLRSIAEEAAKRGAEITRVEKVLQDARRSLSFEIKTVTAAVQQAQAGIREVTFATAEANFAQAGKITQLEASLGNYYQDGQPGRALLEEQMTVTADRVAGLSSQYTLKVQAGKAIAGIGLAATENTDGNATSALIISADKFAIVNPSTYTAGLTNTPDPAHIPFGVDTQGIYMNSNVYVKGSMRVDTGGKTLIDGLRGSVDVNGGTGSWSDTTARNAVWTYLGKAGTPTNNNHLVIGDTVAIGSTVRQWNGSAWAAPGVVINGDMLVNGSVSATKINTYGLVIQDEFGNPILGAGHKLPITQMTGLGSLASQNTADIGGSGNNAVRIWNGSSWQTVNASTFVSALSKITPGNITTYIDGAAIGTAVIGSAFVGTAAIDTLRIRGGSVTSMRFGVRGSTGLSAGQHYEGAQATVNLPANASGAVATATLQVTAPGSDTHVLTMSIYRTEPDGSGGVLMGSVGVSVVGGKTYTHTLAIADQYPRVGDNTYSVWLSADWGRSITVDRSTIAVSGGSR